MSEPRLLTSVELCEHLLHLPDFHADAIKGHIAALDEIAGADCDALQADYRRVKAERDALKQDAERLRFLAVGSDESDPYPVICDGLGGIDLTEQAYIYASALGREMANADDYLAAWRDACDALMKQPHADGESQP